MIERSPQAEGTGMRELWVVWYTPLLVVGAGLLALLNVAVAGVERFAGDGPRAVAPRIWTTPLARAEEALERDDAAAALSWWREARSAALRSGQWEGMIAVGDAARRLAPSDPGAARRAYLTALFRARQQRSLDGILRAAVAFAELGDREILPEALRMAEREAGLDPRALARVRSAAERWLGPPLTTERREPRSPRGALP
jgi:hypothetical protein